MIARTWSARATAAGASRYVDYFRAHVLPELTAIAGYQGADVLTRERSGDVEIVVITRWTSMDAIRSFAGEAVETAVVHAAAAALLTSYDARIAHHTVVVTDQR
jgi:heme-degrading monooxygenase HmoA